MILPDGSPEESFAPVTGWGTVMFPRSTIAAYCARLRWDPGDSGDSGDASTTINSGDPGDPGDTGDTGNPRSGKAKNGTSRRSCAHRQISVYNIKRTKLSILFSYFLLLRETFRWDDRQKEVRKQKKGTYIIIAKIILTHPEVRIHLDVAFSIQLCNLRLNY